MATVHQRKVIGDQAQALCGSVSKRTSEIFENVDCKRCRRIVMNTNEPVKRKKKTNDEPKQKPEFVDWNNTAVYIL